MALHSFDGAQLRQWQLPRAACRLAALQASPQSAALLVAQHGGQLVWLDTTDSAQPVPLLTHVGADIA